MKITQTKKIKFTYEDENARSVTFSTAKKKLTHIQWDLVYEKDLDDLRFMSRAINRFLKEVKRCEKNKEGGKNSRTEQLAGELTTLTGS